MSEWEDFLNKSRQIVSSGTCEKLFDDNYYVFDVIKLLYKETADEKTKLEQLVLIEEFSQQAGVQSSNIDQIVESLLDVFHQLIKRGRDVNVSCQILTTLTTILVLYDQLGLLWKEKDSLIKLMRQERTSVYEDYVMLVTQILQNGISAPDDIRSEDREVDRVVAHDSSEYRQLVSQIMDNTSLFSQGGLWHIVLDLVNIVKNYHEISATNEFEKEVLTDIEERQLQNRILAGLNHPSLTPAQRLFYCHWIESLSNVELDKHESCIRIKDDQQLVFFPSAFDPIDCQLAKLALLNFCFPSLGTVRFLSYLAENSLSVDEGSWKLGIAILSVCQNILVCHGTRDLYVEMGDLLFYLMTHYRDTDIRDKARFYYMLITSATDEKASVGISVEPKMYSTETICMIIQPTTDSHFFHTEAISTLLPNNKAKGHSNVKELEKSILSLEKFKLKHFLMINFKMQTIQAHQFVSDLKTYYSVLKKYKTVLKTVHRLRMTGSPQEVLALCVYFEEDPNCQPLKVNYEFDVDILPKIPLSTRIVTRCEFVDDNQTFRCQLADTAISTEDLIMPLPIEIVSTGDREKDFHTLWDWMEEDTKKDGLWVRYHQKLKD
uniref:AP5B1 middle domain-containing protein n=1 Tax=Magallana gigas TaxID=29159 RepID=K1QK75_MAGGI